MKKKMKIKRIYTVWGTLACITCLMFTSCDEKGLLVNDNDVSYLRFSKDMTKDTTTVSFQMYEEGENAQIAIEVSVSGKLQEVDLYFSVSIDESRTTLPAHLYELPNECKIRKGLLTDTIYVTLKNDPILQSETKVLALQVVESDGIKQGVRVYARALISVTDRLFKPSWWSVNDAGTLDQPANVAESFYLGKYSNKKYEMFLDELKIDDVIFDGKDRQVLRKYSLRLKNTLKNLNAGKDPDQWVKDENNEIVAVIVAG